MLKLALALRKLNIYFKYIYKGHDRPSSSIYPIVDNDGVINEIKQYIYARFMSSPESIYMICTFSMYGVSPAVLQLQLLLENMQPLTLEEGYNVYGVINRPSSFSTVLTKYFMMNYVDLALCKELLVQRVPRLY
jgi:hypothetical protein